MQLEYQIIRCKYQRYVQDGGGQLKLSYIRERDKPGDGEKVELFRSLI